MSTPEHVAMIEATVARQRAFFQTGATRPVACLLYTSDAADE